MPFFIFYTPSLLNLKAPIATKVVCYSRLLKCLRSLYGKQCGPRVCSGCTLFASILNSSVILGNYLQQTTSADDIFRGIFFLGALRIKLQQSIYKHVFSAIVKISVDPDQMAFLEAS